MSKFIEIYTDGSCITSNKKNLTGSGGWCNYIIFSTVMNTHNIISYGAEKNTTNNRMELIAVLESLDWIKKDLLNGIKITIYSDSKYVVNGANEWMYKWYKDNFYISNNKKRINYDLWEKLYTLIHNFKEYITFQWVKAHSTCEYNNLVDNIARNQAENINHTT